MHHLRRPQASFHSPEEKETLRPPHSDLRSPGKISKLSGFRAPDGDSARVSERELHGETSLLRNLCQFFIFQSLFLNTEMLYKSHTGTEVLTLIKVRCFTQMYTEVLGCYIIFWPGGPADYLRPSLCESRQSTLISPGVIILKTDITEIKLYSIRVRV